MLDAAASKVTSGRPRGRPRQYVSAVERRVKIPTAHSFERFALALEVPRAILATFATAKITISLHDV
jgi:hypothetical protein